MNDGILFFPHEVASSDPIKLVEAKFDIVGYGIVYKLFERIFSLGYYSPWNEDVCLLFSAECRLKPEQVQPVVDYAVQKRVFSSELYTRFNILTSEDIQSKFFFAARKRDSLNINNDFLLVDLNKIFCKSSGSGSAASGKGVKEDLFESFIVAKDEDALESFVRGNNIFKPWLNQFDYMVICYAFSLCLKKEKRNLDYLFGILGNWKKQGYTSIRDIDDSILRVPSNLGEDCPEYLYRAHIDF